MTDRYRDFVEIDVLDTDILDIEVSSNNVVDLEIERVASVQNKDHSILINRELPEQHPIPAITYLEDELAVRPSRTISNLDIYEIISS